MLRFGCFYGTRITQIKWIFADLICVNQQNLRHLRAILYFRL